MTLNKLLGILTGCVLVISFTGCNGSGGNGPLLDQAVDTGQPEPIAIDEAGFTQGMPSFGGIAEPIGGPRIATSQNNYLKGRDAIAVSPLGTSVGWDNLILTSEGDRHSWAAWRWGKFSDGVLPETLVLWATVEPGQEYWLFLSDYAAGTWEFIGPMSDGSFSWNYSNAEDYLSPKGYTYVALLVTGGNSLDVQNLNMIADRDVTPPPSPVELVIGEVSPTTVELIWKENDSNGLRRYSVYQGPAPSFDIDGPGVTMIGQPESFMNTWPVGGLEPETEYAFCLTLTDMVGNESLNSNFVSTTTPAMPVFNPPEGLTVIDVGSSWVDLAWLPAEPEPLGYNCFTGTAVDFDEYDPGVVLRNHGLIESNIWRMTDLETETEYHIGAQAYHQEGVSVVSSTVTVTTLASAPPVPGFIYSPDTVMAGDQVTFDPSTTTDSDSPLADLVFKWDFDNDGVNDLVTLGPAEANWMFNDRGAARIKLTVSDGTAVELTEDIPVEMNFEYNPVALAGGMPAVVTAIDTNPPTPRAVALMESDGEYFIRYYDSEWTTYELTAITADYYADVALGQNSILLLTANFDGSLIEWELHEFNFLTWILLESGSQSADSFAMGRVEISDDDKCVIGIVAGQDVASVLEYHIYAWHELGDGNLDASDTLIGSGIAPVLDVQRSPTESILMYCKAQELRIWTIDDSSSTDLAVQSYTGDPLFLTTEEVSDDGTGIFWALATDADRIYYGDNYGEPIESDMFWSTDNQPTGLLGVGHVGDNASFFAWSENSFDDTERLISCAPFPDGGGEPVIVDTGVGLASGGVGGYYIEEEYVGILTIANETRDGECIARFLVEDEVEWESDAYTPIGTGNIKTHHQAMILTDGFVVSLAEQEYPTVRRSVAPVNSSVFTISQNGTDRWVLPHTSCSTRYPGEYFTGGFTENSSLVLVLNVTYGDTGIHKLTIPGVGLAALAYNPFSTNTALCYTVNDGRDLMVRYWGGIEWSDPVLIFNSANTIEALEFVGDNSFGWNAAFIDSASNTWLSKSVLEEWGPAVLMSTEVVDPAAGLGLDCSTDGQCVIAHYRTTADPGIHLGTVDPEGIVEWERVVEPAGIAVTSIEAYFHLTAPLVVFYQQEPALEDSRMHFTEWRAGTWVDTELPEQIHGEPVDSCRDVFGDILFAGYRIDGAVNRAVSAKLHR